MKQNTSGLLIYALFLMLFISSCQNSEEVADLIIHNAVVWTGNPEAGSVTAVAVKDDRIIQTGNDSDILKLAGESARIINANRQFVVPGFIDCHIHFLTGGFSLSSVQLRDAATPGEFSERIRDFVNQQEKNIWILGGDWDHSLWGGELPSREWIDSVTPDNPVFVNRLDGHMALANSKALELAGITNAVEEIEGGSFVRNVKGDLTGILKDNAMSLINRVISEPGKEQKEKALDAAMKYVAAQGVSSVHSVGDGMNEIESYRNLNSQGKLRTRIYAMLPISQWKDMEFLVNENGLGDDWLRFGALKGFVDGSLGSHTAAFFESYSDKPGDKGFFVNPEERLIEWITKADSAKFHVAIHAIGDSAIHTLLNIYERVIEQNGQRDRRFRIEHAQHIHPADLLRFGALGVIPSMQPYHAIDDGRWAESVIGPERIKTTYAFRSLIDTGAKLVFGSDWAVAPPTPLEGIYAAVTRSTLDGENPSGWVPDEKITVDEALRAYTIDAAYASFEEDIKGSIERGRLADLVIIDKDIRSIAPEQIRDAKVVMTIVGGRIVYESLE